MRKSSGFLLAVCSIPIPTIVNGKMYIEHNYNELNNELGKHSELENSVNGSLDLDFGDSKRRRGYYRPAFYYDDDDYIGYDSDDEDDYYDEEEDKTYHSPAKGHYNQLQKQGFSKASYFQSFINTLLHMVVIAGILLLPLAVAATIDFSAITDAITALTNIVNTGFSTVINTLTGIRTTIDLLNTNLNALTVTTNANANVIAQILAVVNALPRIASNVGILSSIEDDIVDTKISGDSVPESIEIPLLLGESSKNVTNNIDNNVIDNDKKTWYFLSSPDGSADLGNILDAKLQLLNGGEFDETITKAIIGLCLKSAIYDKYLKGYLCSVPQDNQRQNQRQEQQQNIENLLPNKV